VDSKDLIPLEDFTVDVAVCLDAWVGMVRHIKSKIRLKFPDGSICAMEDHIAEELEDVIDKRDDVRILMFDDSYLSVISSPIGFNTH
jgi:ubiquitin-conjugating enzyme E2 O